MSSSVVATLVPICNADEELNDHVERRHSLEIRRHSPLVLGRNATTGIASLLIPTLAATISWKQDSLWLERHSQDCSVIHSASVVPLSGKLEDGYIVRLYKQDYAYRVQIQNASKPVDTPKNVDSSAVPFQETSEECMCAVCMEIMVQSTAVVPCGHLYCKECLVGITECPNCRLGIQSTLPVKTMDNVIDKLVTSKRVFAATDVEQYQSRVKPLVVVSAAAQVRVFCIHVVYLNTLFSETHHFDSCFMIPFQPPKKRARKSTRNATPASVDLTVPRAGDTADDAICID